MKWKKNRGCILEVDAKYPKHLHNSHNAYPAAPEKIVIEKRYAIWLLFKSYEYI